MQRPPSPFSRPVSRSAPAPQSPAPGSRAALNWPKHVSDSGVRLHRVSPARELTDGSDVTLGDLATIAGVRSRDEANANRTSAQPVAVTAPTDGFERALEARTGLPHAGQLVLETPGGTREIVASPAETLVERVDAAALAAGVDPDSNTGLTRQPDIVGPAPAPEMLLRPEPVRPTINTSPAPPAHIRSQLDPSPETSSGPSSTDPSPTPSSAHPASQAAPKSPATMASGSYAPSHSPQRISPTYLGSPYWAGQMGPNSPFTPPPGAANAYAYHTNLYAPAYPYPAPQSGFPAPQPMPSSPMSSYVPLGGAPASPSSGSAPLHTFSAQPQLVYPNMPQPILYFDQYGRPLGYPTYDPTYAAAAAPTPTSPAVRSVPAAPIYGHASPGMPVESYMPAQGYPSFAPSPYPNMPYPYYPAPHQQGGPMRPAGGAYDQSLRPPDAGGPGGRRRNVMPRPPSHSEFAMWVGNVPSDSNHAELWRFFTTRPPPPSSAVAHDSSLAELLSTPGVESIHLISRSNCAFVNYSTAAHLDHAIRVCHNVPLRPGDPRTMGKDLVCRIRRKDDDTKTGVGAQRAPGQRVHHQYVQQQQAMGGGGGAGALAPSSVASTDDLLDPPRSAGPMQDSFSTTRSGSTTSTTSSFLARHFPRRYFILKSHTEEDLQLSVERGLWATQSHNEAYRTSRDGVFLIFSANRTGAFFGYARMTGAILTDEQRQASGSSMRTVEARSHSPILEDAEDLDAPRPLTDRLTSSSPQPGSFVPSTAPISSPPAQSSAPARGTKAASLLVVPNPRAETLDPRTLASMRIADRPGPDRSEDCADEPATTGRRGSVLSAEERNARLEHLDSLEGGPTSAQPIVGAATGRGRPFRIEWLKVQRLSFQRTKLIRNPFNLNREVKVSRDGTELEPAAGEALLAAFVDEAAGPSQPTSPRFSESAVHSPHLPHFAGMPARPVWPVAAPPSAGPSYPSSLPPRMR